MGTSSRACSTCSRPATSPDPAIRTTAATEADDNLAAIAFYFFYKRENLVKPMITGFKDAAAGLAATAQKQGRTWLAALLLAACAGGVYLLIKLPAA